MRPGSHKASVPAIPREHCRRTDKIGGIAEQPPKRVGLRLGHRCVGYSPVAEARAARRITASKRPDEASSIKSQTEITLLSGGCLANYSIETLAGCPPSPMFRRPRLQHIDQAFRCPMRGIACHPGVVWPPCVAHLSSPSFIVQIRCPSGGARLARGERSHSYHEYCTNGGPDSNIVFVPRRSRYAPFAKRTLWQHGAEADRWGVQNTESGSPPAEVARIAVQQSAHRPSEAHESEAGNPPEVARLLDFARRVGG